MGVTRPEAVAAVVVGEQVAARGDPVVVVLDVVEAVLVGLPDLDARAGDRAAVGVGDGALDPARLAGGAAGDVAAELDLRASPRRRTGRRPWPRWRSPYASLLIAIGLHRRAEHVGEQDELLPPVVGDVPGRGEELDARCHSSSVSRTSRRKACRCRVSACMQLPAAAGPARRRTTRRRASTSSCLARLLLGGRWPSVAWCRSHRRSSRISSFPGRAAAVARGSRSSPASGCSAGTAGRIGVGRGGDVVLGESRSPAARAARRAASAGAAGRRWRRSAPNAAAIRRSGVGRGRRVERQHVRQHDGVGLGVRQVEHAAQHVADLVVQPRPGRGERDRGEVGAVEGLLAAVESGGSSTTARQARGAGPGCPRRRGPGRSGRRAAPTSSRRSAPARSARRRRSVGTGSDEQSARRRRRSTRGSTRASTPVVLRAALGQAPDVGGLGAGVRRRHRDDRQPGGQRDRLGQPGGRPAADADAAGRRRARRRPRGPARRPRPARA